MKPIIVRLDEIAPQPWRNGAGQTRELLRYPADDSVPWQCRISVADIAFKTSRNSNTGAAFEA